MSDSHTMKKIKTDRGFEYLEFTDHHGAICSIQTSSCACCDALWIGPDNPDPKIMASQAARLGVKTVENTGWIPYPLPQDVMCTTRMLVQREQVKQIVEALSHWLKTGNLKRPLNRPKAEP